MNADPQHDIHRVVFELQNLGVALLWVRDDVCAQRVHRVQADVRQRRADRRREQEESRAGEEDALAPRQRDGQAVCQQIGELPQQQADEIGDEDEHRQEDALEGRVRQHERGHQADQPAGRAVAREAHSADDHREHEEVEVDVLAQEAGEVDERGRDGEEESHDQRASAAQLPAQANGQRDDADAQHDRQDAGGRVVDPRIA